MRYWRNFNNSNKNPHEVIVDNSNALILASVQAFTKLPTRIRYLDACYDNIFSDTKIEIGCYIRLDRSHIVKQIQTMKIFEKVDYRVKRLLQRILGYLITADDIAIVEDIMRNVFMLILNKFEHSDAITEARKSLKRVSDEHEYVTESEKGDEFIAYETIVCSDEETKFKKWIKKIIQEVREKYVNEELNNSTANVEDEMELVENVYYVSDKNKEFVPYLVDFLSIIPLWSNIMIHSFESKNVVATSSPTEATFKDMKVLVFKNESGFRPDLFVEKYLTYLLGSFKFALADCKNKQSTMLRGEDCGETSQTVHDNEEGASSLMPKSQNVDVSQEYWRNKNVDTLEQSKPRKSNRNVNSILEKAKPFSSNLPFLPNGGTTKGNQSIETIISEETCPFDSIYQVYAAFYKDIKVIQEDIDQSECLFDEFIKKSFFAKKDSELIEARNHLLRAMFPEKVNRGRKNMTTLNIFMGINEMFDTLNSNSEVLCSVKSRDKCLSCDFIGNEKFHMYVPMKFKGDWKNIVQNLQSYVDTDVLTIGDENLCPKCESELDMQILLNNILVIHIELAYPNTLIHKVEMSKISGEITIHDKQYEFRAAIEYGAKHFVAHVKRNNGVWQTYNDLKSPHTQKPPKSFYSVLYFYVKLDND